MRIGSIDSVSQIYQSQVSQVQKTQSTHKVDEVQISDEAALRGVAYKVVMDAPEVRMDRVNELKSQIEQGTYNVNARDVSEKLINQLSI